MLNDDPVTTDKPLHMKQQCPRWVACHLMFWPQPSSIKYWIQQWEINKEHINYLWEKNEMFRCYIAKCKISKNGAISPPFEPYKTFKHVIP